MWPSQRASRVEDPASIDGIYGAISRVIWFGLAEHSIDRDLACQVPFLVDFDHLKAAATRQNIEVKDSIGNHHGSFSTNRYRPAVVVRAGTVFLDPAEVGTRSSAMTWRDESVDRKWVIRGKGVDDLAMTRFDCSHLKLIIC